MHVPTPASGPIPPPSSEVEKWLAAHKQLITKELEFSELAMKAAFGAISQEELSRARAELEAMRLLCAEIYRRAFPGAQPPKQYPGGDESG